MRAIVATCLMLLRPMGGEEDDGTAGGQKSMSAPEYAGFRALDIDLHSGRGWHDPLGEHEPSA